MDTLSTLGAPPPCAGQGRGRTWLPSEPARSEESGHPTNSEAVLLPRKPLT